MSTLHVESTRFGTFEVPDAIVLNFPQGMIGFPQHKEYVLLKQREDSVFLWLHSADDPSLALPVTRPWNFFPGYEVSLSDEETTRLTFPEGSEPDVWVTVRAGEELESFSANLKAPILVAEGIAHQVINEAPDAPVRAALFSADVAHAVA